MKPLWKFFLGLALLTSALQAESDGLGLSARFDPAIQKLVVTLENRSDEPLSFWPRADAGRGSDEDGIAMIFKTSPESLVESRLISRQEVVSDTRKLPVPMTPILEKEVIVQYCDVSAHLRHLSEHEKFSDGCVVRFAVGVATDPLVKKRIIVKTDWYLVAAGKTKLVALSRPSRGSPNPATGSRQSD